MAETVAGGCFEAVSGGGEFTQRDAGNLECEATSGEPASRPPRPWSHLALTGCDVAPEALQRVLAAAHAAPSVGLTQPWDFIVVRDSAMRSAFRAHVMDQRAGFAASLDASRADTFSRIKIEGILESAVGIVVTYDPERGAPAVLGRHTIGDTGLYSTCLAIQNLWLAATEENLGVGWVSFYREDFSNGSIQRSR